MEIVHALAAVGVAAIGVVLALTAGAALATGRSLRRALDRLILVALVLAGIAVVTGPLLWLADRPPSDPLHILYAIAVVVALPIARFTLPAPTPDRRSVLLLVAGVLVAGLTVRLAQTG